MNIKSLIRGEVKQEDLLSWYSAIIVYDTLPSVVNGYVFNYDGINFIMINKELSYYKKKKAILHELAHIEKNHLCQNNKDLFAFYIDQYEDDANEYLEQIMKDLK